jgi:hypothetical protein
VRVNLTKEEFMHAYSSQYYDATKAHEYYERNKKLKGRSTSGMSDEQKKTWKYVKERIMTEKKQKTEEIQTSSTSKLKGLRFKTNSVRQRLSGKLRKMINKITSQTNSGHERKVVVENFKTTIFSVREKVKEIKEALNSATEDTLNKEYDNIMANIAGKPAKSKKGKKSGDNTAAKEKWVADNLARLKSKS